MLAPVGAPTSENVSAWAGRSASVAVAVNVYGANSGTVAVGGTPASTGATFDWELVRRRRTETPFVLSGGLSPDNVAAAIGATAPYAVDTASGTEARPGVKDPEKLRAFAAAVASTAPAVPAVPEPA